MFTTPVSTGAIAQSPLQKREQQVQKQDAAEEPLAYTGEIHTHPAGGHGESYLTPKKSAPA